MDTLMKKIKTDFSPLFCEVLFKALNPIQEISAGEYSPPPSPEDQEDHNRDESSSPDSLEPVETIDLATSEDDDADKLVLASPKEWPRKKNPTPPKSPKRWNCHLCGKRGNRKQTGLKLHLKKVHHLTDLIITPKKTLGTPKKMSLSTPKKMTLATPKKSLGSPGLKRWPSLSKLTPRSPKVWTCHLCGKRCNRQMGLTIHLKKVHLTGDLNCHTCGAAFTCKRQVWKHTLKCTDPAIKYRCRGCSEEFVDKKCHAKHERKCGSVAAPKCSTCQQVFKNKRSLREHACADVQIVI